MRNQLKIRSAIRNAKAFLDVRRGFSFVGSTIMYAHMQAVGMVNDHVVSCFRHREVRELVSRHRRRAE